MTCHRFDGRVGYQGQRYQVFFTRDGEEESFGWQNEPTGGLENAAKVMPRVTATRVARMPHTEQVEKAFDMIAKANTVSILSLDEMERVVNMALAGEFDQ